MDGWFIPINNLNKMELIILLLHGLFALFKHKKKENSVGVLEIQPRSTNLTNSKLLSP